jgi:hypothetical protein
MSKSTRDLLMAVALIAVALALAYLLAIGARERFFTPRLRFKNISTN